MRRNKEGPRRNRARRRGLWGWGLCGLLGAAQLACATVPVAKNPQGVLVHVATLPSPRLEATVFSDGRSVYVAGGQDDTGAVLSQIVRFDPSEGTVTVLPEALPRPTYSAGVAWTGESAFMFGGLDQAGAVLDQIVRYTPSTGEARLMSAKLPLRAYNTAAVWTGAAIYIFGGYIFGGPIVAHLDQIVMYDPASDMVTPLASKLPVGVEAPGVLWDGKVVWLLGGKIDEAGTSGAPTNTIQVFDPQTQQARLVGRLPYAVWDAPGFSDGKGYYLPGGHSLPWTGYDSILHFDPSAKGTRLLPFALPIRLASHAGTWVSSVSAGYLCGGENTATRRPTDMILRVRP
jgi:hypothetical protein